MTAPGPARAAFAHVKRVRVGSRNRPKLEAVRSALGAYTDAFEAIGVDVESGVPDQPVGFEEIVAGARTRAHAAFESGPCDLAVGIEDGLVVIDALGPDAVNVGAAAVTDGRRTSIGLSSGFAYPSECGLRAIAEREPVGGLFDALMDRVQPRDSGEAPRAPSAGVEGNVGRLTAGALPRSEYGRHAVLCALVRFLHPGLYQWLPGEDAAQSAVSGSGRDV